MRKFFFALIFLAFLHLSWANAPAGFGIISDIDDTVKLTNVLDHDTLLQNAALGRGIFLGMPELYQALQESSRALGGEGRLTFLSGAPRALENPVRYLFEAHHFSFCELIMKRNVDMIHHLSTQ